MNGSLSGQTAAAHGGTRRNALTLRRLGIGSSTLLVVPIVAAAGLTIPRTSSRAITSPAGTADTMETLAPVTLDSAAMRRVVEQQGGCVVWGGSMGLSPMDDLLIGIGRPLDLDS